VGVLFFGACGGVILLVPFVDRGPISRQVLNILAAAAVAFFIFMTAWGWFARPDQVTLRILLGALQTVIVLPLVIPFTERGSTARQAAWGAFGIAAITLLGAAGWELFS